MLTCEILKENTEFIFKCVDGSGQQLLKSQYYQNKSDVFTELAKFTSAGYKNYVYEICDEKDCFFFKISNKGVVLLESVLFENRDRVYELTQSLQGGCVISHIIDKSFVEGNVIYYLTCTNYLKFKEPYLIELEKEDDEYVGAIKELNLYSYSDNINEIIEDLKIDLDELYDTLYIEEKNLSTNAIQVKEKLNSNLVLSVV